MCLWDGGCPAGMADMGLWCQKEIYTREIRGSKICPLNSEFINEKGFYGPACWDQCEDGKEHPGLPTCFGSCPAGTTLCGAEGIGTLCLDDNQGTCEDYVEEIAKYTINWTVAITSGNWWEIVKRIAGDHPEIAYPICEEWND